MLWEFNFTVCFVAAGLLQNLSGPYREEAASLRMLASLLHTSASPLCVTDALSDDMPILWVNRVFEHSTGYTAAEVCSGTSFIMLMCTLLTVLCLLLL